MDEIWSAIAGYPDYAVSNHGRVVNVKHDREVRGRISSYGAVKITLRRDGRSEDWYLHQLVARAFMSGWRAKIHVTHRDDDKTNNHVLNLKFGRERGVGQYRGNPDKIAYRRVRIVETGEVFRSVHDCARYLHGDPSSIYKVLRGERDAHLGYTFEYYEEYM